MAGRYDVDAAYLQAISQALPDHDIETLKIPMPNNTAKLTNLLLVEILKEMRISNAFVEREFFKTHGQTSVSALFGSDMSIVKSEVVDDKLKQTVIDPLDLLAEPKAAEVTKLAQETLNTKKYEVKEDTVQNKPVIVPIANKPNVVPMQGHPSLQTVKETVPTGFLKNLKKVDTTRADIQST